LLDVKVKEHEISRCEKHSNARYENMKDAGPSREGEGVRE